MTFSLDDIRLDGCIIDAPGKRDFRTVLNDREVPESVDLRRECTPVENQGQIGSCTANASVGALEYHYQRRDGHSPDLSRMFVYFNARRLRGDIFTDSGAQIAEAMAAVLAYGACREEIWPYNPALFAEQPSPEAYADAKQHEAIQYSRVDGSQGSINALAEGFPVVFGICLPGRCYAIAGETGVMPQLADEERREPPGSGHAMLIVGYDKKEQMFIVRNSWGEGWADRGYCKIPFSLMDTYASPDHFWIVAGLENESSFSLVRPGREGHRTASLAPTLESERLASTASRMRNDIRTRLEADITSASRKIDERLSGRKSIKEGMKGYGRCSLCNCAGYDGTGLVCERCGHSYEEHW